MESSEGKSSTSPEATHVSLISPTHTSQNRSPSRPPFLRIHSPVISSFISCMMLFPTLLLYSFESRPCAASLEIIFNILPAVPLASTGPLHTTPPTFKTNVSKMQKQFFKSGDLCVDGIRSFPPHSSPVSSLIARHFLFNEL